jgi:hypothetical protein
MMHRSLHARLNRLERTIRSAPVHGGCHVRKRIAGILTRHGVTPTPAPPTRTIADLQTHIVGIIARRRPHNG